MKLFELVSYLQNLPPSKIIGVGFGDAHSYRGSHQDVAFCIKKNTTVANMLSCAKCAIGMKNYYGWADDFHSESADCYIVEYEGCGSGEGMGNILLDFMTGKYQPSFEADGT